MVFAHDVGGVPAAWFSNNVGAAAGTSLAGLMTSQGGAAGTTFVYDFFRIDRNTTIAQAAASAPGAKGEEIVGNLPLSTALVPGAILTALETHPAQSASSM